MGNVRRQFSYIFPPGATNAVASTQILAGAGALVLNGSLSVGNQTPFINYGYSRQVSITGGPSAVAVIFTVVGIENGVIITENITGINGTAYGVLTYDTVTSITSSGAVAAPGVSGGSGYFGFFKLIQLDLNAGYINGAISLATTGLMADPNTYTLYGTADNIFNNGQTLLTASTSNYNLFTIENVVAATQYYYGLINNIPALPSTLLNVTPFYQYLIQIGTLGTTTYIANGVKLNFFQIAG